ncbi:MAG: nuclear transport factor 2 family protein [Myxococcota bacterium]
MPTTQEISDQIEIARVLNRYFRSMDTKDYGLLDSVFTPDAEVHYENPGDLMTTYRDMVPVFEAFNDSFFFMQHMASQFDIEVDGDTAISTNNLRAVHFQETNDGRENRWVVHGTYRDELVRTPDGWRVRSRHFRGGHIEGELLPADQVKSFPRPRHLQARP